MDGENNLKYIENAVLFCIFNKVDSLNKIHLINLYKSFYNLNEIEKAKQIINNLYNKVDEKITRKGLNK